MTQVNECAPREGQRGERLCREVHHQRANANVPRWNVGRIPSECAAGGRCSSSVFMEVV
jgi:hypothetical protein